MMSEGAPWVAHRVWPMPTVPGRVTPPSKMPSSTLKRPLDLTTRRPPSLYTATPAESYPRYSSFCRPDSRMGAAWSPPIYPTMPHIDDLSFPRGVAPLA